MCESVCVSAHSLTAALCIMFVLVEMVDTVRIPPWNFQRQLNDAIAEELNKKLANKVCVCVCVCVCAGRENAKWKQANLVIIIMIITSLSLVLF